MISELDQLGVEALAQQVDRRLHHHRLERVPVAAGELQRVDRVAVHVAQVQLLVVVDVFEGHHRSAADHRVATNSAKLVHGRQAAENCPGLDLDMSSQRRPVGKNGVVLDDTVMSDM